MPSLRHCVRGGPHQAPASGRRNGARNLTNTDLDTASGPDYHSRALARGSSFWPRGVAVLRGRPRKRPAVCLDTATAVGYHSQALDERASLWPVGWRRGRRGPLTGPPPPGIIPRPSMRGLVFAPPRPKPGTLTSWRATRPRIDPQGSDLLGSSGAPKTERAPWRRGAGHESVHSNNSTRSGASPEPSGRERTLVESLILAQDQRWRRA